MAFATSRLLPMVFYALPKYVHLIRETQARHPSSVPPEWL